MKKKATATELLKYIVHERKWYGDLMTRSNAFEVKKAVEEGTLSEKKATEILIGLGWKMVQPPVWEKV